MEAYAGTVERLCDVDIARLLGWASSVPYEEWPQQHRLADGKIRPSMLVVGEEADDVVATVMCYFPGCGERDRLLSVVMPGHSIEPHCDDKGPDWICRIHVPLETNRKAVIIMHDGEHHMRVGGAYKVNVLPEHSVRNDGKTPRLHFMFDVVRGR